MNQSELPTQVAQKSYGNAIILLPSALGIAAQGLGGPLSLPCLCLPPGVIQILSFIVCAVECESLGSIVKILTEIDPLRQRELLPLAHPGCSLVGPTSTSAPSILI